MFVVRDVAGGKELPIDPTLLEMLACPVCGGEVRPTATADGVECVRCGRVYPIRNGIPVMLVEEATPPTHDP